MLVFIRRKGKTAASKPPNTHRNAWLVKPCRRGRSVRLLDMYLLRASLKVETWILCFSHSVRDRQYRPFPVRWKTLQLCQPGTYGPSFRRTHQNGTYLQTRQSV